MSEFTLKRELSMFDLHNQHSSKTIAASKDKWLGHKFFSDSEIQEHTARWLIEPNSASGIRQALCFTEERGISVIARGGGSGVCGAVIPVKPDTLIIDTKYIRHIKINKDLTAWVGSGRFMERLDELDLRPSGLQSGHTPASRATATIGGSIALSGAGKESSSHGMLKDQLLAIKVVHSYLDAEQVYSGDGLKSFLGAMGTSGIITEALIKIFPLTHLFTFNAIEFPDMAHALAALSVMNTLIAGTNLDGHGYNLRLYDPLDVVINGPKPETPDAQSHAKMLKGLIQKLGSLDKVAQVFKEQSLKTKPLMCINAQSHYDVTHHEQWQFMKSKLDHAVKKICTDFSGQDIGRYPAKIDYDTRFRIDDSMVDFLWGRGCFVETFDIAVPLEKIQVAYAVIRVAMKKYTFLTMAHVSHIRDNNGCIYFTLAGDKANYHMACRVAKEAAIFAGAKVTHHHGLGMDKKGFEKYVYGPEKLAQLKEKAIPIFNPGKL